MSEQGPNASKCAIPAENLQPHLFVSNLLNLNQIDRASPIVPQPQKSGPQQVEIRRNRVIF
jgi:hypothetical protein